MPLGKRYPKSRALYKSLGQWPLGFIQPVWIDDNLTIINMLAQDGFVGPGRPLAVDYAALEQCLGKVAQLAEVSGYTVQMPRIGCGLGGGCWQVVEQIIQRTLIQKNVPVRVVDLQ